MSSRERNRIGLRIVSRRQMTPRGIAAAAFLVLLAASFSPLLHAIAQILVLAENFAAQLIAACLCGVAVALVLRLWRWAILVALAAAWNIADVAPFVAWPGAAPPPAAVAGPPLKVLSLNVLYTNTVRAPVVDYLLHSDADFIGVVEATPEWIKALQPIEAIYPYHLACVGLVYPCSTAVYSKLPFRDSFAGRIGGRVPAAVTVTLDWQGHPLTLTELQLTDPLIGSERGLQAFQANILGGYIRDLPGDQVVMGDFNSAPWSGLQDRLRERSGLDNRGRLAFTWPSWAPAIFRLPIDQIFARGNVTVRNYRAGPMAGSDHLPVLAEIYRDAP